ncbi:hypothetical protein AWB78_01311 [Caballeronia calidae]|uniref:Uncharacterized protein n=1 Tax=Caballeronia calidae TaxID=1777139 RepID=A0A158A605_9BURK|nr:hypothetical protein [Caballeronia calidae]SAK53284.1 hypothetical protein AWB78_01311 [Caballeronia calidae]
MSRPVVEITDEMILSRLISGDKLTVTGLASLLELRREIVRRKVFQMVDEGKILRKRESENQRAPYLYFVEHPTAPTVIAHGEFEIPQRLITRNLTGEIKGYDAELNNRMALCMTLSRIA